MKEISTTLTTVAQFSDDGKKRYLLTKTWEADKPHLAIIMLAPSEASGIVLDNTTMLVLNNASTLGYGSVTILNLFATLGDYRLKTAEESDTENLNVILDIAQRVDTIVYAAGVGKATNKTFLKRQTQVLTALLPYEQKLHCLISRNGTARFQHPLSPAVRTWVLSEMKVEELCTELPVDTNDQKTAKRGRPSKK